MAARPNLVVLKRKILETEFIIKICGITRREDFGYILRQPEVNAVGFVAYPPSKRFVTYENVGEIISGCDRAILKVGVFVDASFDFIMSYVRGGLEVAQLHGDEPPEFAEKLSREVRVWKALRPRSAGEIDSFTSYPAEKFLIDAFSEGLKGGTGLQVDREMAIHAVEILPGPVILSGGLTPENVTEALRAVSPAGVDVSSGVEISPGVKDTARVRSFISAVSEAI